MNDTAYYDRRAEQERAAADKASCNAARIAHQSMAARYAVLAKNSAPMRIAA